MKEYPLHSEICCGRSCTSTRIRWCARVGAGPPNPLLLASPSSFSCCSIRSATRWCCARSPIHCEIVCTRRCSGPSARWGCRTCSGVRCHPWRSHIFPQARRSFSSAWTSRKSSNPSSCRLDTSASTGLRRPTSSPAKRRSATSNSPRCAAASSP